MDEIDETQQSREQQLECELERAHQRIAELESARSAQLLRDDHLALLSHDLRSPLSVIIGRAGLLQRRLTERALLLEAAGAEAILRNGHRMNAMIQDLVDAARLEAAELPLHKASVELRALLGWTLSLRVGEADRPRVVLEDGAVLPPVALDAERIERVVCKLVGHLLRATAPETPVLVKVERREAEAVVSVAARGAGLDAEVLKPLFERFSYASSGRAAEGLGLYVSRLIVEAHGGRLWVESDAQGGSRLAFALPLAGAEEPGEPAGPD